MDYIGIENEVASFKNKKRVPRCDITKYFEKIKSGVYSCDTRERNYYTVDGVGRNEMVRSDDGNVYYLDASVIEISTPPIRLTKGFSSRLSNLLMIGREKVSNAMPDLNHTGYSMHWNLTAPKNYSPTEFIRDTAIPFQYFGLTPSSVGFNLRNHSSRWELLGDSIQNESQINAAALLLGSYSKLINSGKQINLKSKNHWKDIKYGGNLRKKPFVKSRNDLIEVEINDSTEIITSQLYLEKFYKQIYSKVKKMGSKNEILNLEGYIFGESKLEIENIEFHKELIKNNMKNQGFYFPYTSSLGSTILKFSENRKIPIEGRMMGEMAKYKNKNNFSWDNFSLNIDGKIIDLSSIENIYSFFGPRINRAI